MKRCLCLLLLLALLCGCSEISQGILPQQSEEEEPAPEAQRVTLAWSGSTVFDPVSVRSRQDQQLSPLIYEGLYRLDGSLQAQPVLCQSVSQNGDTWRFTIKSGVTFHSGAALTAQDVADSLNRARQSADSPYAARLSVISSIQAQGSDVVIVTREMHAGLPKLLDVPICRESQSGFYDGTGPYVPVQSEGRLSLNAYAAWHGGQVSYDTLELITVTDEDVLFYSFETGGVTMVYGEQLSADPASFTGDVELTDVLTTSLHYIGVNCRQQPLALAETRRALSLLLDRVSLAQGPLQDKLLPLSAPCLSAPVGEQSEDSVTEARRLLAQAGVVDRNDDGLLELASGRNRTWSPEILVAENNEYKLAAARQYAEALQQVGIAAVVQPVDEETFLSRVQSGDFDLYYGEVALYADLSVDALLTGALNYGAFAEATAAQQLATLRQSGQEAAFATWFAEQSPLLVLGLGRDSLAVRGGHLSVTPLPHAVYGDPTQW